jgi:hypothetical protein
VPRAYFPPSTSRVFAGVPLAVTRAPSVVPGLTPGIAPNEAARKPSTSEPVLVRPDEPADLGALCVVRSNMVSVREREAPFALSIRGPRDDRRRRIAGLAADIAHEVVFGHAGRIRNAAVSPLPARLCQTRVDG